MKDIIMSSQRELISKAAEKRLQQNNNSNISNDLIDDEVQSPLEYKSEKLIDDDENKIDDVELAMLNSLHDRPKKTAFDKQIEEAIKASLANEPKNESYKKKVNLSRKKEIINAETTIFVKVVKFKGYWTRDDVTNNPNCLFIFGDNVDQQNHKAEGGGQAVIRGLNNAMGLPTKQSAGIDNDDYFDDDMILINKARLILALELVRHRIITSSVIDTLVIPEEEFGVGWAELDIRAPQTYSWLKRELKKFYSEIKTLVVCEPEESSEPSSSDTYISEHEINEESD